jgi:transcriptional regulator with XRE-family HTH domain
MGLYGPNGLQSQMTNHSLSGGQIRAARALLRWSVEELARQASLGLNTIKRAEAKDGRTSLTAANELAIRRVFEAAGVEFTNGDKPGVRLFGIAAAREEGAHSSSLTIGAKIGRGRAAKATTKKR